MKICSHVPYYKELKHKSLYGGDLLYGRRNRHGGMLFYHENVEQVGLVHSVFALYRKRLTAKYRLFLIRFRYLIDPINRNRAVVEQFGHKPFKYQLSDFAYINTALVPAKC